jgi:hypothetical protein
MLVKELISFSPISDGLGYSNANKTIDDICEVLCNFGLVSLPNPMLASNIIPTVF